ncbi:branched-chain amino acid ABC transporter permease [Candidatus Nomurabacteria bacterium]|nr:branched-chain amino acid ABC transporter permease [Candidatus Nomurabacteria bacterium]
MGILPQLILNSIIAGAIYSMVALGFNLIYSTTRFFDLGYGAITAVGGYTVFWLYKLHGVNLPLSILVAIVVAGLIGVLADVLVYRRLRARRASTMVLLVASLGVFTMLQAVIAIIFSSQFQTLSSGGSKVYGVWGGAITEIQLIILCTAIVVMLLLGVFLKYTRFGRAIRAVGDDEEVARVVGINTNKIIRFVFFVSAGIGGLSGLLVGFDTGIEPTMGLNLLLKGVIAAIVGGIGSVWGGVLGAFFLGFVENFGIWQISGEWKDAIAFALLIVFLLFRPQGLIKK